MRLNFSADKAEQYPCIAIFRACMDRSQALILQRCSIVKGVKQQR